MLGVDHSLPQFLIDDTSDITNARIFVVHTQTPRFIGELLPEEEAELDGITISVNPGDQVLCRINWIDRPRSDSQLSALIKSLREAIDRHDAVRG